MNGIPIAPYGPGVGSPNFLSVPTNFDLGSWVQMETAAFGGSLPAKFAFMAQLMRAGFTNTLFYWNDATQKGYLPSTSPEVIAKLGLVAPAPAVVPLAQRTPQQQAVAAAESFFGAGSPQATAVQAAAYSSTPADSLNPAPIALAVGIGLLAWWLT